MNRPETSRGRLSAPVVSLLVALLVTALGFAAAGSAAPGVVYGPAGSADLKVTKSASVSSAAVGSNVVYTITVENLGPDPATGVVVSDPLPSQIEYLSATSTVGQCSKQGKKKAECSIGTLEAGATAKVSSATVTLTVHARKEGTVTNTASAKADQKDPAGSNNKSSATVRIVAPPAAATCRGIAASVVGTTAADNLRGTSGRDVIAAFGGNDTITALAGGDLVCAGRGRDIVNAGGGADRVFGGGGPDRLLGRSGADLLRGGRGVDTCRGGPGVDSVKGCER